MVGWVLLEQAWFWSIEKWNILFWQNALLLSFLMEVKASLVFIIRDDLLCQNMYFMIAVSTNKIGGGYVFFFWTWIWIWTCYKSSRQNNSVVIFPDILDGAKTVIMQNISSWSEECWECTGDSENRRNIESDCGIAGMFFNDVYVWYHTHLYSTAVFRPNRKSIKLLLLKCHPYLVFTVDGALY